MFLDSLVFLVPRQTHNSYIFNSLELHMHSYIILVFSILVFSHSYVSKRV